MRVDLRNESGPFDIIGDVHGCASELESLLEQLGYEVSFTGRRVNVRAPEARRVVFVGDLVDRGPRSPDVLRMVMAFAEAGQGLCVPGNHDVKFLRWLNGRNVRPTPGLDRTIEQFEAEPSAFRDRVRDYIDALPSHPHRNRM